MRIIRKPRESIAGVREALAKAHNDGWMNGFEAGKVEGRKESKDFTEKQRWVQHGDHYVGKHIDDRGNVFHIYTEDSPLILPGQPSSYMQSRGESSLAPFCLTCSIEIVHTMVGMRANQADLPSDDPRAFDNAERFYDTAYFIPYRKDGFLR